MKFLSPSLCCSEGRSISSKALANKHETIFMIPQVVSGKLCYSFRLMWFEGTDPLEDLNTF